jgi:hypothetical protein
MSIFDDALEDIFADTDMTIPATYKGVTIRVDFRDGFLVVAGVESSGPHAECLDTDIAGVGHGDMLVINAITYYVQGIQPSGFGTTILILSEEP